MMLLPLFFLIPLPLLRFKSQKKALYFATEHKNSIEPACDHRRMLITGLYFFVF